MNISIIGNDINGCFREIFSDNQHSVHWHNNLDQFATTPANVKIFLIGLEKKMFLSESELQEQRDLIHTASECSDFVFVSTIELHQHSCHLLREDYCPPRDNVYWLVPGTVAGHEKHIIARHAWLQLMQYIYRPLLPMLDTIDVDTVKPLWFDALLGRRSLPRLFVTDQINQCQINSKVIHSIRSEEPSTLMLDQNPDFVWEPGCKLLDRPDNVWLYGEVEFHGQRMPFGHTLPLSVHQQTAYSVLSETEYSNQVIFLTEKTAKVMLCRRIFVSFGSRGYLKYLQSLGFRTFDSFMDESYDLIEDSQQRWQAAWAQLMWLCNQDQQCIIAQARDILLHNYHHMISTDWRKPMVNGIKQILNL